MNEIAGRLEQVSRALLEAVQLSDWPWQVVPVAGGALVLVLIVWVGAARRRRAFNEELEEPFRNRRGRAALKKARRLARQKKRREAAQAFVAAGRIDDAVTQLRQAGEDAEAAELLVEQGRTKEAGQLYRQLARWERAARLLKQTGEFALAAECFEQAGQRGEAAECWEKAGELDRAGEAWMAVGQYAQAARAFERCERDAAYVDAFVRWWEEELERQMGQLEPASFWLPAVDAALRKAIELESWEAAFRLGVYQGSWPEAAQAAEELGRLDDAVRFYEEAGDLDSVARVAERAGDLDRAVRARASAAEQRGDLREAAEAYEQAGEARKALALWEQLEFWEEAARVAESLDELEIAARAWGNAGNPLKVGELSARLERWDAAGRAYEEAGAWDLAHDAFVRGEDFAGAARVAERAGRNQLAIEDLQQVLRRIGQDRGTMLKMVELMMAEGMRGPALGVLESIVTMQPADEEEAQVLYAYAMLLEEEQRFAEAARAYERLLGWDVNYRDARARAERMRAMASTDQTTGGGGAGDSNFFVAPAEVMPKEKPGGGDTQKLLERYEVTEELGRGGMGVVVRAHDRVLDRPVALKIVKTPGGQATPKEMERIVGEARATARLNHPNIVQIYDCAVAQGNFVMAMEFVEGRTVAELIREQGTLPVPAVVLIFGQVAKALEYAHEQGIVHRDIKPANLLWTVDKQVKVTDFGLARATQELANTQTVVVGSPYYMAPEQVMGTAMDHRVDIYALGVSMYEALTGRCPFVEGDIGYQHVHTPPPDPRTLRADVPEALARLVMDMLAKEPDGRPQDCAEVLLRLREVVAR